MNYLAGYAQKEINPRLPVRLAGFDEERISDKIHDSLFVRVILMRAVSQPSESNVVLISVDTLVIDFQMTKRIQTRLGTLGIDPKNVIVAATHTHSGPAGLCWSEHTCLQGLESTFGKYNEDYASFCVDQIEIGVKEAMSGMMHCEIQYRSLVIEGVASERHGRDTGESDLLMMEFLMEKGRPVLLYCFACHPTILHGDNLQISADLCYGVEQSLSDTYDMVMFLNGAAGDQSTRYWRKDSSMEEVIRMGELIGSEMRKKTDFIKLKEAAIKMRYEEITLALKEQMSPDEAEELLTFYHSKWKQAESENRLWASKVEGARANQSLMANLKDIPLPHMPLTFLSLGPLVFVSIPGELTSELWKLVISKYKECVAIGYANGYQLYIVDEASYDHQEYEAMSSPLKKGEGEKLMEFIGLVMKDKEN